MAWDWEDYGDYVSADEKRRRAGTAARKLEKHGRKLAPVQPTGRSIAESFWGKAWCKNLESYSDYASRLPRGRSYLRQGAVLDLQVGRGEVRASVSGTRLYEVQIKIDTLSKAAWTRLKADCAGKVGSLMNLLQGKLAAPVMEIVTRKDNGLFPEPGEIKLKCSCPDHADLCKHVAATLYGVGARLDAQPELLFFLRGVDHLELIASAAHSVTDDLATPPVGKGKTLDAGSLSEIFGIEMEPAAPATPAKTKGRKASACPSRKSVAQRPTKPPTRPASAKAKASPRATVAKRLPQAGFKDGKRDVHVPANVESATKSAVVPRKNLHERRLASSPMSRLPPPVSFDGLYPAVAAWMKDGGWVEIGYDDCQSSFIRVLDIGGMIWEGKDAYPSVDEALQAAEKAIRRWQKTHG